MDPKPRKPGPDSTRKPTRPDNKPDDVPLETYERSQADNRANDDPRTNPSQPTGAERTARDEP